MSPSRSNKSSKSSNSTPFSLEDKKFIQKWKFQLNEQGIPRKEWASIIQGELQKHRDQIRKKQLDQKGLRKIVKKIKKKGQKFLLRWMMRRQGQDFGQMDPEMMDQLLDQMGDLSPDQMSDDPFQAMADQFLKPPQSPSSKGLHEDSTFLTEELQKKSKKQEVIIEWDDDDEE